MDSVEDKDETAKDLRGEIDRLEGKLDRATRKYVYVTGPGGLCRHAYGHFHEGEFNPDSPGVLWDVGLEMCECTSIDVNDLGDIEIRVGGVVFANASDVAVNAIKIGTAHGNKFDGDDMSRSVTFLLSSGVRNDTWDPRTNGWPLRSCWLKFHLMDIDDKSWENLQIIAKDEDIDTFEAIVQEIPHHRTKLTSISFCAQSVWDIIDDVERGPEFDEEKKQQFDRMYDLMSKGACEIESNKSSDSNEDLSEDEEQSNDEASESSNGSSDSSNNEASEEEDQSNDEAPENEDSVNNDDGEKSTGSNNDKVAMTKEKDSEALPALASEMIEIVEQERVRNSTDEPLCKKQKVTGDVGSPGEVQESGGQSESSSEMSEGERIQDAIAFLQMKSLYPKRVQRPRRTVKFVGAWMQL